MPLDGPMPRKRKQPEPDLRELMRAEMIRVMAEEIGRDLTDDELAKVDRVLEDWKVPE